ncbi:MAG: hypothetical protein JWR61_1589 [Ferruginibacter sp.]|nr:hypothetical protein [Ferruginibacter sp.]
MRLCPENICNQSTTKVLGARCIRCSLGVKPVSAKHFYYFWINPNCLEKNNPVNGSF